MGFQRCVVVRSVDNTERIRGNLGPTHVRRTEGNSCRYVDESGLDGAGLARRDPEAHLSDAAIVIFCTGHHGHTANTHLDEFDPLLKSPMLTDHRELFKIGIGNAPL